MTQRDLMRFLSVWLTICGAVLACIAAFNFAMDPYLLFDVPRVDRFNARKPAALQHERAMKPYDVIRVRPNTVLLGSSRIDLGLDAEDPLWPAHLRPVYNLSYLFGGPYMAYRHLQHLTFEQPVALVLLGLDFEYFLAHDGPDPLRPLDYEARLATTRDGRPNPIRSRQYATDLLRTLALSTFLDSAQTLRANLDGDSYDLSSGSLVMDARALRRRTAAGSLPYFAARELGFIEVMQEYSSSTRVVPAGMQHVASTLELCASRGVRLALIINPVHADVLELLDHVGLWHEFEAWKRALVSLVAQHQMRGCEVVLWDFSGYDRFSTESVLPAGRVAKWYLEPAHFNRALGSEIIRRVLGAGDPSFGAVLTQINIEDRLSGIRAQRQQYRRREPAAVQRVRALYDTGTAELRRE